MLDPIIKCRYCKKQLKPLSDITTSVYLCIHSSITITYFVSINSGDIFETAFIIPCPIKDSSTYYRLTLLHPKNQTHLTKYSCHKDVSAITTLNHIIPVTADNAKQWLNKLLNLKALS
jgi:hypothetical protein